MSIPGDTLSGSQSPGLHNPGTQNLLRESSLSPYPSQRENGIEDTQESDYGSDIAYRSPPLNYEAERALLGAILMSNSTYDKVADFLAPEHFADPLNGDIYQAAGRLIERGQIADIQTIRAYFEHDGALAEIGGVAYLVRLGEEAVSILNAVAYGRVIYDLALRRMLITLGTDLVNDSHEADIDRPASTLIEEAEQKLYDLATLGDMDRGPQNFSTSLRQAIGSIESAYQNSGQLTGIATGFRDLDKLLGGLHRSDLVILAGRPSMGKTALATNIAFHIADSWRRAQEAGETEKAGAGVAFFSLEMSSEQLATRILAEQAAIRSEQLRRGTISDEEFQRLVAVSGQIEQLPLYIDDSPALTISAMRSRARRLKRLHNNLGLVVVDYLQLVSAPGRQRVENRVLEVGEISRGLKALAKELDVPVLALSQLSRKVEDREDKRPQLADLRESGSIEQDADIVMFIFREEYYCARTEPEQGTDKHDKWREKMERVHNLAEVIVAKQRHGPIGNEKLHFDAMVTKFSDHIEDSHLPESFS